MADEASSIFNKRATEKLRSPDDLDRYIQVTNPSVWVVIFAIVALLAGLLIWGVFGTIVTSVEAEGVVVNNRATCYLPSEDIGKVSVGNTVNFGGVNMEVAEITTVPLSRDEVKSELGSDYLASTLATSDWSYAVHLDGDTSSFTQNVPVNVNITVDQVAPITLILNGQA